MKNRIILVVIFSISLVANAQKATTSKDSITTFYYKFLYMLEHEYLDKKNINWKTIEKETKQVLFGFFFNGFPVDIFFV